MSKPNLSRRRPALRRAAAAVLLLGMTSAVAAGAQDRPEESDLFGAPSSAPASDSAADGGSTPPPEASTTEAPSPLPAAEPAAEVSPPTNEPPGFERDRAAMGGPSIESRFDSQEEKTDPLKVGGMLYLRAAASAARHQPPSAASLSVPMLVDGYFDARPSDRVRGFVLVRMRYDPVLEAGSSAFSALAGLAGVEASPTAQVPNPSVDLDQLWLRFDVAQTVFVTAGKQHVKWGASRFWNPTDFLTPERKDPLAAFDARLGANMVKVHVPWEAQGWNFYALALFDNAGPASQLGKVGGAARAEVVLGATELGADAVLVKGRKPRVGFDLSSALGPIDVYGEVALRSGKDFNLWRATGDLDLNSPLSNLFEPYQPEGLQAQASGGFTYTFNYTDKNTITLGAEYFYNPVGASTPLLYPWLMLQGQFQPFYAARHYAGLYALAPSLPGDFYKTTLSLSQLANLSDLSFVTRLDAFVRVLSYLSVELFGAAHYGRRYGAVLGGEFAFGLDLPPLELGPGQTTSQVYLAPPALELGVGLRLSL